MNLSHHRKRRPMHFCLVTLLGTFLAHSPPMRTPDVRHSKTILTHSVHELFYLRWWNTLRAKIKVSLQKCMKTWGPCAEESTLRRQQIRPKLYNFKGLMSLYVKLYNFKGLMSLYVRRCTRHYRSSFLFRTNSLISDKTFLIMGNTRRLKWRRAVVVVLCFSSLERTSLEKK